MLASAAMRFGSHSPFIARLSAARSLAVASVFASTLASTFPSTFAATSPTAAAAAAPAPPAPQESALANLTLVDRIVAVVEEDPILASDLERAIGLGLVERKPEEGEAALLRRALEVLIDQRLRAHEIDRLGAPEVSVQEVERQVATLGERFADEAAFTAHLGRLGLDRGGLAALLARQLAVLASIDERLGPRVFVSLEDMRAYYREVLTPALAARGETPPPFEEVRESIRGVLREERLNLELERWTEELRREADVETFLDEVPTTLPPLAATIGPEG